MHIGAERSLSVGRKQRRLMTGSERQSLNARDLFWRSTTIYTPFSGESAPLTFLHLQGWRGVRMLRESNHPEGLAAPRLASRAGRCGMKKKIH